MVAEMPVATRFGSFTARPEDVVTIADGLPGFAGCRRFVVVAAPALQPFTCLHSLDAGGPSFLALDPRLVVSDYAAPLPEPDRRRLDAEPGDALLWLALVRLEDDGGSVNLCAPIVINPRRMLGLQLIAADSRYATDHPLLLD